MLAGLQIILEENNFYMQLLRFSLLEVERNSKTDFKLLQFWVNAVYLKK